MKGTVSDTAFRDLPGARVEILNGPNAGMSTTVDARGEFSLTGRFDETTQFRATSEGHVAAVRTLQPFCVRCNPTWWINFTLDVLDPPVNVAGTYTLTIVADSSCTMLPSDARSRTFTATIPQDMAPAPVPGGLVVVPIAECDSPAGMGHHRRGRRRRPSGLLARDARGATRAEPVSVVYRTGRRAGRYIDAGNDRPAIRRHNPGLRPESEAGRYEDCYQSSSAARVVCTASSHQFVLTRR